MSRPLTTKITRLALLATAGLALFLFESLIPRPLPWIKPGLSQIATLIALYVYGWRESLAVVVLRVGLAALLTGSFAGPGFWLALPAGVTAALVMAAARAAAGRHLSIAGVSMIGALTHNLIQLALVRLFYVRNSEIWTLLPMVWLPALFTGLAVGLAARMLIEFGRRARLDWGTNDPRGE